MFPVVLGQLKRVLFVKAEVSFFSMASNDSMSPNYRGRLGSQGKVPSPVDQWNLWGVVFSLIQNNLW